MLVKYVTQVQILAHMLLKPVERILSSVVLTSVRTATPTTNRDIKILRHLLHQKYHKPGVLENMSLKANILACVLFEPVEWVMFSMPPTTRAAAKLTRSNDYVSTARPRVTSRLLDLSVTPKSTLVSFERNQEESLMLTLPSENLIKILQKVVADQTIHALPEGSRKYNLGSARLRKIVLPRSRLVSISREDDNTVKRMGVGRSHLRRRLQDFDERLSGQFIEL